MNARTRAQSAAAGVTGTAADRALAASPRWTGATGRMEVWYTTLTDPATGAGLWVHYETVAPTPGRGAPYGHGWITLFPGGGAPRTARFGPAPVEPAVPGGPWFDAAGARAEAGRWQGRAGPLAWELAWDDPGPPLFTFAPLIWRHQLLPAAQVVIAPRARFSGQVVVAAAAGGETVGFDGAVGGVSHIYGHGSARRWGWVHADLGGGDVLELVSAVSLRPGLRRLPPLTFVRLRLDGRDWPTGVLPPFRLKTRLGLPGWSVAGQVGGRHLRIEVHQPPARCVALQYIDPDGGTVVCTNTEQADLEVTLGRSGGGAPARRWTLSGTAHAEVGLRGAAAPPVDECSSA